MARTANLEANLATGRLSSEGVAAGTRYLCFTVLRMDAFSHDKLTFLFTTSLRSTYWDLYDYYLRNLLTLLAVHRLDEFRVGLGLVNLVQEELHRINRV